MKEGHAPEDLVLNLLWIFQSAGVLTFNDHFKPFKEDCRRANIHRSVDPNHKANGSVTTDDKTAACCVLTFAEWTCCTAMENAEWDKCLNQEPRMAAPEAC